MARRKDGSRFPTDVTVTRVRLDRDYLVAVSHDVSALVASEEALKDRERKLLKAQQVAGVGFLEWDLVSDEMTWSDELHRILGTSPETTEASQSSTLEFTHPDDRERVTAEFQRAVEGAADYDTVHRVLCPDGSVLHVQSNAEVARDDDGKAISVLVTILDITERVKAEGELEDSERRFRGLIENSTDGVALVGGDGTILYQSPAIFRILGYTPEERIGKNMLDLAHPEDRERLASELQSASSQTRETQGTTVRMKANDGTWRWIQGSGTNMFNVPGINAIVVNYRDVTEQRELEDGFRQAQKVQSVGLLAGGIAHDFNNILTAILACSDFILAELDEDSRIRTDAVEIKALGQRASQLTRQLLAFSRQQPMKPTRFDLNGAVEKMHHMLRRVIPESTPLELELARAPLEVLADPGLVEQVIMNLVVNARDATEDGGSITVETAVTDLDDHFLRTHPGSSPGTYVVVTVTDTGHGMTKEVMGRIFDPFFTTKEPGKGSGLGLSTVYGIVKQSSGYITFDSTPGAGSSFRVYLPKSDQPRDLTPAAGIPSLGGTETILLVDDEEGLLRVISRMLTRCGYTVLTSSRPDEALQLCEQAKGKIDVLLTDVVMPGMNGLELARRVAEKFPDIEVMYMSGHAPTEAMRKELAQSSHRFIPKPFELSNLLSALRNVLSSS